MKYHLLYEISSISTGAAPKRTTTPSVPPRDTAPTKPVHQSTLSKKLEIAKRTQGLISQNVANQKLILSKLETCKVASEKKGLMETLRKLQESHANIKTINSLENLDVSDRKRKMAAKQVQKPATTRGAATNLDLRPREIIVKNCNNAEELQDHFRFVNDFEFL